MFDEAKDRLIVALDLPTADEAITLMARVYGPVTYFKVGLELFAAEGPSIVRRVQQRGGRVMLDLKLHDIPETVRRAAAVAAGLGVQLITVHAAGGLRMLEAAVQGANDGNPNTRVLAVTVLTSLDIMDLNNDGHNVKSVQELVLIRARRAMRAGCHGIVASASEAAAVRAEVGMQPIIVTPAIRLPGGETGDQKRVDTPRAARQNGASAIVVGRPIRDADDPQAAAKLFIAELE